MLLLPLLVLALLVLDSIESRAGKKGSVARGEAGAAAACAGDGDDDEADKAAGAGAERVSCGCSWTSGPASILGSVFL